MDLQIPRWIREQDENGAVSLARTLCLAEAGRHKLPLDTVAITGRVKAADQGVDGRTNFSATIDSVFPVGPQVWQIKSGGTAPSAAKELHPDKHAGLLEAIASGRDYVLFWTNDPPDPTRQTVQSDFLSAVQAVRADAKVSFLFSEQIERLCHQHVAVLAQNGPVPLGGLVGLDVWARTFELIDYEADEKRLDVIEVLRDHAMGDDEPYGLQVVGDTGVGKSRLVYQALLQDGLRQRVLVVPDPSSWDRGILTHIANTEGSSLVLVVDDCDADDRRKLTDLVGMSEGRIRLITIGSRATRERQHDDRRRLEMFPLAMEASKKIALSRGLDEKAATRVADLTEGYPGIADRLATAIAYGGSDTALLDRIRRDDDIGPLLATLVAESDVLLLGLISLFERIGFDGDVEPELGLACRVFGVEEKAVRTVADRELNKFVSTAGRYRRVTPRLFAVWLASRFLEMHAGTIVDELNQLPDFLRQRIVDQMRQFAGDQVVKSTLGTLLEQAPFNSGAVAGVDDGAARLIHVASIVNPPAAMTAIERIMDGVTTQELAEVQAGRRGLLEALEVLMWSDEYFERSATASLRLAIAENEHWANNATGVVQGIYRVFLGGTSVDYRRRIAWTRQALQTFGEEAAAIIVPGLASAFDINETRMSTDFGGGVAPTEWRPATLEEEITARKSAWDLLIDIARRDTDSIGAVATSLAKGVRTALLRGMSADALASLRTVDWPARGRAELIEALNHARTYDEPDARLDGEIVDLITDLTGESLSERARYVFAASVWELTEKRSELIAGLPGPLVDLVDDVASAGPEIWHQMIEISKNGNSDTASRFFEQLANRAPSVEFEQEMEDLEPPPLAPLMGYLRGLVVAGVVDPVSILQRWSTRNALDRSTVRAVHLLPANNDLARLAIAAVERGSAPAEDLGQFLYGGWARSLDDDVAATLLKMLGEAVRARLEDGDGPQARHALDHAFGIADQWTEDNSVPPAGTRFRSSLDDLLSISEEVRERSPGGSSMLDLHISQIVPRMSLTTAERLEILMRRFQTLRTFPSEYVLAELEELISTEPNEVASKIVEFLKSGPDGFFQPWSIWLEDAKLLTRIQRGANLDHLTQQVVAANDSSSLPQIVGHIAFDTDDPDPLLVAVLGRSDDAELRGLATFRFMHPRSSSWGLESDNLRRRREVAARWRASSGHPALFGEWLDEVVEALDSSIRHAEEREAEERR